MQISCVRGLMARGGNLPREGVNSWKRNAEPNRQESQAGRQAGNRSIALARTHGPVSRYTSRRGILRLLWVAPVQNIANATISICTDVVPTSLTSKMFACARVYCISRDMKYFPSFLWSFFYASSFLSFCKAENRN